MELFEVIEKSSKKVKASSNKKVGAKIARDELNESAGWKRDPNVDNSNSMPYVVTYGKDHWKRGGCHGV